MAWRWCCLGWIVLGCGLGLTVCRAARVNWGTRRNALTLAMLCFFSLSLSLSLRCVCVLWVQAANESAILDIEDEDNDAKKQKDNAGGKVRERGRCLRGGTRLRHAGFDRRQAKDTPTLRLLVAVVVPCLCSPVPLQCGATINRMWCDHSAVPLQCGATVDRMWCDHSAVPLQCGRRGPPTETLSVLLQLGNPTWPCPSSFQSHLELYCP